MIGPALAGVTERRENEWLKAWIKNNAALRASGDRDAIAIFNEYNGSVMSAFPQLSDAQIDDILYYTEVGNPKPVCLLQEQLSPSEVRMKHQAGLSLF